MTKLSASRLKLLETSTKKYQESLSEVWPYLEGRGLTEETVARFRLGYVKEPLHGDESFDSRLCIPYLRRVGVVAQRFRTLSDDPRKYLGRSGVATGLFHVDAFFGDADTCVITEGEFDTIVLAQIGIPSVGIPGTKGWKRHYGRLFEDFDRVIVFRDNDEAGKTLVKEVTEGLADAGTVVVSVPMPVNDVNATYLDPEYGEDWLREMYEKCRTQ
jgi:DNA primase